MFVPIFVVVLMSFNDPRSRATSTSSTPSPSTTGCNPCEPEGMCARSGRSIEIGLLATLGGDDPRHPGGVRAGAPRLRRAARSTNLLIFLPMASPEIVMGSSLLALFVAAGFARPARLLDDPDRPHHVLPVVRGGHREGPAGRAWTTTSSRRRWTSTPRPRQTFWRVTFPLVFPGILGAALLSFSLSFDDFIITNLNAGNTTTFPMYVWGVARNAASPCRSTWSAP